MKRKDSQEARFFNGIASYCGFNDIESVRKFYFAFIRHVINDLKVNEKVRLPLFGYFYKKRMKARTGRASMLRMGNPHLPSVQHDLPERTRISFRSYDALRDYFRNR